MKKFMLVTLVTVLSSSFVMAQSMTLSDVQKTQVLGLLLKNDTKLTAIGEVKEGQTLRTFTQPLSDLMASAFDIYHDDEDTSDIKKVSIDCTEVMRDTARCAVIMDRKPIGETSIIILVKKNVKGNFTRVIGTTAEIVHGD